MSQESSHKPTKPAARHSSAMLWMANRRRLFLISVVLLAGASVQVGPERSLVPSAVASIVEGVGIAIHAATLLFHVMGHETNKDGKIMFAKTNDGCLAGDRRVSDTTYAPYPWNLCPPEPWIKWRFEGRLLIMSYTPRYIVGKEACMDCFDKSADCDVVLSGCTGDKNQQWSIQVFPHQIDAKKKRVYFSIKSFLHTDRCLTMHKRDVEDWVSPLSILLGIHKKEPFNTYKLDECTGNHDQSFYLERHWFDELDSLIKKNGSK